MFKNPFTQNRQTELEKAWLAVSENPDKNIRQLREFRYKSALLAEAQQQGRSITFPLPIFRI